MYNSSANFLSNQHLSVIFQFSHSSRLLYKCELPQFFFSMLPHQLKRHHLLLGRCSCQDKRLAAPRTTEEPKRRGFYTISLYTRQGALGTLAQKLNKNEHASMAEEGRKQNRSRERAIVLNYLNHDSVFPFGNPVLPFEAKNARRRGKLGSRREIFDTANRRETTMMTQSTGRLIVTMSFLVCFDAHYNNKCNKTSRWPVSQ